MGGKDYIDRILTPEVLVEVSQFEYNLATHAVVSTVRRIPQPNGNNDRPRGLGHIPDPLKEFQIDTEDESVMEIGSVVSRKARESSKLINSTKKHVKHSTA
eukprot:7157050-Ditylum_brightwellii.AAC.1